MMGYHDIIEFEDEWFGCVKILRMSFRGTVKNYIITKLQVWIEVFTLQWVLPLLGVDDAFFYSKGRPDVKGDVRMDAIGAVAPCGFGFGILYVMTIYE